MGRKIPARKHIGVRDPNEQRRKREEKLKNVINAPPSNADSDQPLPKSVQELNRMRQLVIEGKYKRKPKNNWKKKKANLNVDGLPLLDSRQYIGPADRMERGMKRPEKAIPTIQQRPGEKNKTFLYRMTQLCEDIIRETKFEDKYKVDVVRNTETGQVENLKKKGKDEIEEIIKEEVKKVREETDPKKKKLALKRKKREEAAAAAREQRLEKRKNRRKLKKEKQLQKVLKKNEEKNEFTKHETVKFGEVVHRPPELKVIPRKAVAEKDVRGLMFNQMLIQGKKAEEEVKLQKGDTKAKKKGDGKTSHKSLLSGKRKDLPPGERRMIEEQQKAAIAAYRLMKIKKAKQI